MRNCAVFLSIISGVPCVAAIIVLLYEGASCTRGAAHNCAPSTHIVWDQGVLGVAEDAKVCVRVER